MPETYHKTGTSSSLPLEETGIGDRSGSAAPKPTGRRRLLFIPLIFVFLFSGAVIGMYFQPPALRAFFGVTGLEPGGGTDQPIAKAPKTLITKEDIAALETGAIVALGHLLPKGDVATLAAPYGAGEARIAKLLVHVGENVTAGQILAEFDNRATYEARLNSAKADYEIAKVQLTQTQQSLAISQDEAQAALNRAKAEADVTGLEQARTKSLADRGVATTAQLDRAKAAHQAAQQEVQRLTATVARYAAGTDLAQTQILLAQQAVNAAKVRLESAHTDLDRTVLTAPTDGTILDIYVRAGERPGSKGILDFGNTAEMIAEVEVYQSQIRRIALGEKVRLKSEAFDDTLTGSVTEIGLLVGRQSLIGADPAANTDARVVTVTVTLDTLGASHASRLINLEVLAWFDGDAAP